MPEYRIIPMGKPRMTQRDKWARRPAVLAYHAFKDACRAQGITVPDRACVLFNLPMPASWSAAKKARMVGQPHTQRPDLDNLLKALMDAVHEEDSHVWSVMAEKRWSYMPSIIVEAV